jgi:hypothetical protein
LFDILCINNRDVDKDAAVYFPGSSKIKDSYKVLTNCFCNFITEKQYETNEPRNLASLDEIVSGGSVSRIINAYNSASRLVARSNLSVSEKQREQIEAEADSIRKQFPLMIYGIKEVREKGTEMKAEYLNKVQRGEVLEFPTKRIITMDNEDYQTVKFAHPNSSGFNGQCGFYPKVQEIVLTEPYLSLLSDVARLIGLDPESVNPARSRVMSDCAKYSAKI